MDIYYMYLLFSKKSAVSVKQLDTVCTTTFTLFDFYMWLLYFFVSYQDSDVFKSQLKDEQYYCGSEEVVEDVRST